MDSPNRSLFVYAEPFVRLDKKSQKKTDHCKLRTENTLMNNHSAELLARYRDGDSEAADELFYRYWGRLTRLARTHLSEKLARRVDPEDIVLSAYRSFFVNLREGRFTFQESGDLWRLLAQMTMNKLYRNAAHHSSQKRSINREVDSEEDIFLERLLDQQPTPEEAVALVDEVETLLASLTETERAIIEHRLEGATHAEIAKINDCSEKTVSRILSRIREQLVTQVSLIDSEERTLPEAAVKRSLPIKQQPKMRLSLTEDDISFHYSDFILQQLIGVGGVGKVYRAIHKKNKNQVAIKFLKKNMLTQSHVVQRFLAEEKMIRKHSHPHLVKVHGLGRTPNGGYFIVMDFIEGRNLDELSKKQNLSITNIIQWISDAAQALHFIHQQGIVHCDLKPANILIDSNHIAKVTDFGFARSLTEIEQNTPIGLEGTAPFMAPEQIDTFWGKVSPRTDVYGLGAVLFTLLTGKPLFHGDRISEIFAQIMTVNQQELEDRFPSTVSKSIRNICLCCLQKEPARRFQTAEDFGNTILESLK